MKTELKRSSPLKQGVSPEYIINFLNACEKADSEIHGIMIARNNEVIFEAYNAPMPRISSISCIPLPKY